MSLLVNNKNWDVSWNYLQKLKHAWQQHTIRKAKRRIETIFRLGIEDESVHPLWIWQSTELKWDHPPFWTRIKRAQMSTGEHADHTQWMFPTQNRFSITPSPENLRTGFITVILSVSKQEQCSCGIFMSPIPTFGWLVSHPISISFKWVDSWCVQSPF